MLDELKNFRESLPVEWLLKGEPFVKYRTLTDLLGLKDRNKEVVGARKSIKEHKLIKGIFRRRNIDGYWGRPKDIHTWWPKKDTTFWILGILADFGLTKDVKEIAVASEYVFENQFQDGGFGWAPPKKSADCFTGILVESLAKLGYIGDPRLRKAYDWVTERQRHDGGFWCKNTGLPGKSRQLEPSCAFATLCVLGALSQNPELRNCKIAEQGVEFLLGCWENRGKIKYAGHDSDVGKGWDKLKYPFTDYRILKYLDILSQFDCARKDPRIGEMLSLLKAKKAPHGQFFAESIHKVWSDFDFGQKTSPSRWITMLIYRIISRFIS